MLESQLKAKAKKLLEQSGWLVVHIIQCNLNGWPDTMILKDGKAIFIEFKRPGKKARALQEYRMKKIREKGFEAMVIDDLKMIEELLQSA